MLDKTSRLYYEDSQLVEFDAQVVRVQAKSDGRYEVHLTQSAFYPTSGGQPHDTGTLGDANVVDVFVADGEIVHVVDGALAVGETIIGRIDWNRRFDHMQQHCGQHILSAAFEHLYGWHTVSFHLSEGSVTVDLDTSTHDGSQIQAAEALANRVIFEDRAITTRFVEADELASIPLWKPAKVAEDIRIVTIEGFDYNACGGTHPLRTGQVGLLKVLKVENTRQGIRLTFACGGRALRDYVERVDVLTTLSKSLSVGVGEMGQAVTNLQASLAESKRRMDRQNADYHQLRAKLILLDAGQGWTSGGCFVYLDDEATDVASLKLLLQGLAKSMVGDRAEVTMGVVGEIDGRIHLFVKAGGLHRADELLNPILQEAGGKGGGQKSAAQGSAPVSAERPAAWFERKLRDAMRC